MSYHYVNNLGIAGGGITPGGDQQIWIEDNLEALEALTGVAAGDLGIASDSSNWYIRNEADTWMFYKGSGTVFPGEPIWPSATFDYSISAYGTVANYSWDSDEEEWVRNPVGNFIFPEAVDPPFLLADSEMLKPGDRQATNNPNRLWEWSGAAWEVRQATETDVTSLPTSNVIPGALGFVGTIGFVWNGSSWSRSGATLDQPYKWDVSTFAELPLESEGVLQDDLGSVGTGTITGDVAYDGTNWQWTRIVSPNKASLPSDGTFILTDAVGTIVGSNNLYGFNGTTWVRGNAVSNSPTVWSLSGLDDFPAEVVEGDYGVLVAGGRVVRYKAACTVAAGAGGGTMPIWLSPEAYAGTPVIQGWAEGTEATSSAEIIAAYGAKGLTVTPTGTTSISTNGTETIFSAGANSNIIIVGMSGSVFASTKVEIQMKTRASLATSSGGNYHFTISDTSQVAYHTFNNAAGGAGGQLVRGNSAGANAFAAAMYRGNGASALPGTGIAAEWIQVVDEGAGVMTTLIRNGLNEISACRAATTVNFGNRFYISVASAPSATGNTVAHISKFRLISF
jgi:hypothetical protein